MAVSGDGPSPEASGRFREAWRRRQIHVLIYAAGLTLVAVGGLIWADRTIDTTAFIMIPAVLIGLGFAGTESTALHIEIRRESHSISLSGFPLLLGVLALNPVTLVVARVIGTVFALAVVRGRSGVKLIWNSSLCAAETVVAVAIASLATSDGELAGVADWLILLGALLAAELVSLIAVPIVIMVSEGSYRLSLFSQIARSQTIAVMSSAFAVVIAAAAVPHGTTPLVIGMAPFIGVAMLLRFHGELGKKYDNLDQLHEFTSAISGAEPVEVGLQRLCTTLRARGAVIMVPRPDGQHDVSALVDDRRWDTVFSFDEMPRMVDGPTAISVDHPGPAKALFNMYSARNGMAADLPGLDSGFVLVLDRLGAVPRFTVDESRLFGSMASTLGARLSADSLLRKLEEQAGIDPLTELANRSTFEVELLTRLDEPDSEGAVLIIDLDRFKEVNDSLGHQFGDSVLCTVSERLRETVGAQGMAARLGGDEFAVVLTTDTGRSINNRVGEIAEALARPIELEGIVLDLGGSIGVAEWPTHGRTTTTLLRDADIAMYEAKRTQRAWVRFESRLDDYSSERLALMGELREAIGRGELCIHLQPQVRADGGLANAEALVRWLHPVHGMIPPGEFVSHAEHSNVAGDLTRFVIDQTMQAAVELKRQGLDLGLSVNLTSRDLLDRRLPAEIASRFEEYGLEPNRLTFEVTENSVISDIDAAIGNLAALRGLGCRTSIDDFGTGHASLGHLQRLPLDEAKLDQSFITNVSSSPDNRAIVRSMTQLFHDLDLEVVAEGVEQAGDADILRTLGCDLLQGHLFSDALPLDAFIEFALAAGSEAVPTNMATVTRLSRPGRAG
ncbi:MAG: EAL domain-containing protein [Actinomycetota bacterium]